MKALALAAIRFYQRHISPRKGFCCAFAAYTGERSCSALGYRAIRRFGVIDGMLVLDRRLARCGTAYRLARPAPLRALRRQAGDIDCGGCDGVGCDITDACDLGDCCDWNGKRKKANVDADNEAAIRQRSRKLKERNRQRREETGAGGPGAR